MPSGSRQQGGSLSAQVAGVLRAEVARQRISQSELAKAVGVSQSQLSKFLGGRREPNVTELEALCDALGISVLAVIAEAERRAAENHPLATTIKGLSTSEAVELQAAMDNRRTDAPVARETKRRRPGA